MSLDILFRLFLSPFPIPTSIGHLIASKQICSKEYLNACVVCVCAKSISWARIIRSSMCCADAIMYAVIVPSFARQYFAFILCTLKRSLLMTICLYYISHPANNLNPFRFAMFSFLHYASNLICLWTLNHLTQQYQHQIFVL